MVAYPPDFRDELMLDMTSVGQNPQVKSPRTKSPDKNSQDKTPRFSVGKENGQHHGRNLSDYFH